MKASFAAALLFAPLSVAAGHQTSPLSSVLSLIDELQAKVIKEGEAEAKAYKEYFEWCDDTAKNGEHSIKTAESQKAKLEAKIGELTSEIDTSGSTIEELAAAIAKGEGELKDATVVRQKEEADFKASEAELVESIDTLGRAISLLSREMAKNPAALAQVQGKDMSSAIKALSVVLDAAAFSTADQNKLQAFLQAQQSDDADDADFGAPAAATYKTHSGGILDTLEDLKEKAEGQLADLRKAEVNTHHNFAMLKQSLEDQAATDKKDMDDEKTSKAASAEAKATAEGDLQVTLKDLSTAKDELSTAKSSCMQVAADHEATVNARTEELKVLAEAKKVLEETSSGASSQTYSLLQFDVAASAGARMKSHADLARSEVIVLVKRLAKKTHSAALAQLASRIAAVVRYGSSAGEDPFAKVKDLITGMIAKLESEAGAEATEKAYCDEQMAKTEEKKSELDSDIAKMTSKIDQAAAKSAQLKEEIAELQSELSALTKQQAEMDKLRMQGHEDYVTAKADLELGLSGVRKALQVLRDYYAADSSALLQQDGDSSISSLMQQPAVPQKHSSASGAGQSIIGILEVVESDFATNLAKEESEEADSQEQYDKVTQETKVSRTMKEQDVTYKTKESKSLDKTASEVSSDRETANSELSAVLEYYAKIKERCIARPESYSERKERREAEIQGLKEALSVLEDETAFVQRKRRSALRGASLMP